MKVFTRDYRVTGDFPAPFDKYFHGMRYCVLDIETTGLSRDNARVILVGLLMQTESGVTITQFLAENHYEEHKVLDAVLEYFEEESVDYLITYNGAAFDVPFLNARLDANFSGCSLRMYDFDLYRFIKTGTDLKSRIGSLSQKSVENYYGILEDRGDTITGRESVTMFDEYSLTGNSTLEKIILTHNREDVLHLHRLMYLALSDVEDMDSALASYGFPIMDGAFVVRAEIKKAGRSASAGRMLRVYGDQMKSPFSAAFFPDADSPIYASFNASSSFFEIEVPVLSAAVNATGSVMGISSKNAAGYMTGEPGSTTGNMAGSAPGNATGHTIKSAPENAAGHTIKSAPEMDVSLYIDLKALDLDTGVDPQIPNEATPNNNKDDNYYYDNNSNNSNVKNSRTKISFDISDDPDYVNGFLILNPRTVNLVAALLTESVVSKSIV